MAEKPLYAKLYYEDRKRLGVTFTEFAYLDMIAQLSRKRWCIKSLSNCAEDLGLSKYGTLRMRDRLIAKGYIEKNKRGELRMTPLYTEVAVNKVGRSDETPANFGAQSANKVQRIGQQSATKTNKRPTQNLGEGFLKYQAAKKRLLAHRPAHRSVPL